MEIKNILTKTEENQSFKLTALISRFQIKTTKNQNQYLDLYLIDSTGELLVRKWNYNLFDQQNLIDFKNESIVIDCVIRKTIHNNRFQYVLESYELNFTMKKENFFPRAIYSIDKMWNELQNFVNKITDTDYQKLLKTLFSDQESLDKFKHHRAAIRNHHNVYGGLLWHTLTMLKTAEQIIKIYHHIPINQSLLFAGIILHDWGKIYEIGTSFSDSLYTLEGRLIGHISIGAQIIEKYAERLNLNSKKMILLKHCVLASHGKLEFGSPVQPAIIESLILSKIDDLDAKLDMINRDFEIINPDGFTNNKHSDFAKQGFYFHFKSELDK